MQPNVDASLDISLNVDGDIEEVDDKLFGLSDHDDSNTTCDIHNYICVEETNKELEVDTHEPNTDSNATFDNEMPSGTLLSSEKNVLCEVEKEVDVCEHEKYTDFKVQPSENLSSEDEEPAKFAISIRRSVSHSESEETGEFATINDSQEEEDSVFDFESNPSTQDKTVTERITLHSPHFGNISIQLTGLDNNDITNTNDSDIHIDVIPGEQGNITEIDAKVNEEITSQENPDIGRDKLDSITGTEIIITTFLEEISVTEEVIEGNPAGADLKAEDIHSSSSDSDSDTGDIKIKIESPDITVTELDDVDLEMASNADIDGDVQYEEMIPSHDVEIQASLEVEHTTSEIGLSSHDESDIRVDIKVDENKDIDIELDYDIDTKMEISELKEDLETPDASSHVHPDVNICVVVDITEQHCHSSSSDSDSDAEGDIKLKVERPNLDDFGLEVTANAEIHGDAQCAEIVPSDDVGVQASVVVEHTTNEIELPSPDGSDIEVDFEVDPNEHIYMKVDGDVDTNPELLEAKTYLIAPDVSVHVDSSNDSDTDENVDIRLHVVNPEIIVENSLIVLCEPPTDIEPSITVDSSLELECVPEVTEDNIEADLAVNVEIMVSEDSQPKEVVHSGDAEIPANLVAFTSVDVEILSDDVEITSGDIEVPSDTVAIGPGIENDIKINLSDDEEFEFSTGSSAVQDVEIDISVDNVSTDVNLEPGVEVSVEYEKPQSFLGKLKNALFGGSKSKAVEHDNDITVDNEDVNIDVGINASNVDSTIPLVDDGDIDVDVIRDKEVNAEYDVEIKIECPEFNVVDEGEINAVVKVDGIISEIELYSLDGSDIEVDIKVVDKDIKLDYDIDTNMEISELKADWKTAGTSAHVNPEVNISGGLDIKVEHNHSSSSDSDSEGEIKLKVESPVISVTDDEHDEPVDVEINIECPEVKIEGDVNINVECPEVKVDGEVDIKVECPEAKVEDDVDINVECPEIKVDGDVHIYVECHEHKVEDDVEINAECPEAKVDGEVDIKVECPGKGTGSTTPYFSMLGNDVVLHTEEEIVDSNVHDYVNIDTMAEDIVRESTVKSPEIPIVSEDVNEKPREGRTDSLSILEEALKELRRSASSCDHSINKLKCEVEASPQTELDVCIPPSDDNVFEADVSHKGGIDLGGIAEEEFETNITTEIEVVEETVIIQHDIPVESTIPADVNTSLDTPTLSTDVETEIALIDIKTGATESQRDGSLEEDVDGSADLLIFDHPATMEEVNNIVRSCSVHQFDTDDPLDILSADNELSLEKENVSVETKIEDISSVDNEPSLEQEDVSAEIKTETDIVVDIEPDTSHSGATEDILPTDKNEKARKPTKISSKKEKGKEKKKKKKRPNLFCSCTRGVLE